MSVQKVNVTISGTAPSYQVNLSPAAPYCITEANSTLTLQLNPASSSAGFRMAGIGFNGLYHGKSTEMAESQLTASIKTTRATDDTLEVTDANTQDGQFEFILLYQDSAGTIYGLDPEILNDRD